MNPSLANQQQALVAALFAPDLPRADDTTLAAAFGVHWLKGLRTYRGNGHANAERALAAAYPVLRALLGSESLAALARCYWHDAPPHCADLARWGAGLPDYLAIKAEFDDFPYLPDVARAEWALHRAATAADGLAAPSSFARLGCMDPATLRLRLAPGTALVSSPWPVASLVLAHQSDPPDLHEAAIRLRDSVSEHALIWRHGLQPRLRAIEATAAARLQAALAGKSLQAIFDAEAGPLDDALAWIASGIKEGWVLGIDTEPVC